MQEALSRTPFIHDPSIEEMVRTSAQKCRPPAQSSIYLCSCYIRHCDVEGKIIHVFEGSDKDAESCARKKCAKEYKLDLCCSSNYSLFSVTRGEEVVIPKNVIPIVAGYSADGRKALLPFHYDSSELSKLVIESDFLEKRPNVEDDKSSQSNCHGSPDKIKLYCLRYPLDTYPRLFGPDGFMRGEGAGIDATGPYSWRFTENLPHFEPEEPTNDSENGHGVA